MRRSRGRSTDAVRFAQSQRQSRNEFSETVWHWLRNRQCCGLKFRREYPIPPYTVDFCCLALKLVVEVDGAAHLTAAGVEHDRERDRFLMERGYRILRVRGYDVIREDGRAREQIEEFVQQALLG
jgi:very-short-patch-repair endonuclease